MIHLTNDELYNLAELTFNDQPYNKAELTQMKHLKTCEECYRKFCAALAMMNVTSEAGYMMLSEIYNVEPLPGEKLLAVIRVIKNRINHSVAAVMEQLNEAGSRLHFAAPFMLGARSPGSEPSSISRLEEAEAEKTFVLFDAEKNELFIQLDLKPLQTDNVRVYLDFDNSERITVPLERKGNIIKGILRNIPDGDFKIRIERMDKNR